MSASDWTAEKERQLYEASVAGVSYGKIARQLGMSKNAVVAKARRTGCPARPSPLRGSAITDEQVRKALQLRADGHRGRTIAATLGVSVSGLYDRIRKYACTPVSTHPRPRHTLAPLPTASAPPAPSVDSCTTRPVAFVPAPICQWPLNDGRPWRFCGAPTVRDEWPGVYCREHMASCFRSHLAADHETPGTGLTPAAEAMAAVSSPTLPAAVSASAPPALLGGRDV